MTITETRPPYLDEILKRGPNGRGSQGNPYAVNASDMKDPYSIGFDSDGDATMSYYDIRAKELEEFREKAEHEEVRPLPDGGQADIYTHGDSTLISVKLANGYSYNATFPQSPFFDHSVGRNGEFITQDKSNGSAMIGVKVDGNRWYEDISGFKPSLPKSLFMNLENGKIGLQFQKDGRVAISLREGHIESHSFFLKTAEGAILTCDGKGELTLADTQKLPKDISEQDRLAHVDFLKHPTASMDTLIASPMPRETLKQEYQIASASNTLRQQGVHSSTKMLETRFSQTARPSKTQNPVSSRTLI